MNIRIRKLLTCGAACAMVAASGGAQGQTALAGGPPAPSDSSAASASRQPIIIPRGKSAAVDFDFDIRIASSTDPAVADVTMVTSRHAVITGKGSGDTDIQFYNTAGQLVLTKDVRIQQDHGDLERMISSVAPDSQVEVRPLGDRIVLTGTVPNNFDADKIVQLAASVAGSPDKVLNFLVSTGNDQVMLKVEVVEVDRNSLKQLGFDTNAILGQLGMSQFSLGNTPSYAVNGGFLGGGGGGYSLNTTSQPVGTSPASLFANLFQIPFGATGITAQTIGQFVNTYLTGGTLTSAQSSWVNTYLSQYANKIVATDTAGNTYTMADVGITTGNLPAEIRAYQNGTSTLSNLGNNWIRNFLSSLPTSSNAFLSNVANPTSTFIDRSNPANPVATGLAGSGGLNQAQALLQAFERIGTVKTLAEPTLNALSGQESSVQVGGEYPVPTGRDNSGNVTTEFKPFGVALSYTPVVLSNGLITMQIKTEVSELSNQGALTLAGVGGIGTSTTIPALSVRRATNTVDMAPGSSIMLAGLLQDSTAENIDKVPGLADVPLIGAAVRSRDYNDAQTELVIIATVELVHPTSRDKLQTPADGLKIASDVDTVLLGKLNTVAKTPPAATEGRTYEGPFGNVID